MALKVHRALVPFLVTRYQPIKTYHSMVVGLFFRRYPFQIQVGHGSQCMVLLCPSPTPNAIHFFQFRLVYSQSSFSRLTERVLHMPTAASYKSSERPRTWASWKSQKKSFCGRRQVRNDNHTRLSQTLQLPLPARALICCSSITEVGGWGHHS